ncbi:MAG: phosphohistidine phosphatase SixA [Deltaproteobacteria bacterium]|nr:phosphohistidine phosphatase SixA [Deltaproteobacteria bacterium]
MALYLVQHGKNLPKEEDPDKGLSAEGTAEVERMAAMAEGRGLTVSTIKHSGKKRAKQTAEIFARVLHPANGVESIEGMGPLDDVAVLDVKSERNEMLVGHLPFMEKLTAYLVAGDVDQAPVFKFQNSGIVCLKHGEKEGWYIAWALVPNIP